MKCLLLALLLACSSAFSSDFRFSVDIGPRVVVAPPAQTIVYQEELVWIQPVYETRVDSAGNVYTILVREGYYVKRVRPVILERPVVYSPSPRPFFGFSFGFGSHYRPCPPVHHCPPRRR